MFTVDQKEMPHRLSELTMVIDAAKHERQLSAVKRYSDPDYPDSYVTLSERKPDSIDVAPLEAILTIKMRSLRDSIMAVTSDNPSFVEVNNLSDAASNTAYWARKHDIEKTKEFTARWKSLAGKLFHNPQA